MANAIQFQAGGTVYNIKDIEARTDINAITESTINLFVPTDEDQIVDHGVTITNYKNGKFKVTGTATNNGVMIISQPITLPAGSYKFGFLTESPCTLQIRDYTGGSDQGGVSSTTTTNTFTLSEAKTVIFRIYRANGTTYNATIAPMITKLAEWSSEFIPYITAIDFTARLSAFKYRGIAADDLNNCTEYGFYLLNSGTTYANAPALANGKRGYLLNMSISPAHNLQVLIVTSEGDFYVRRSGGNPVVWSDWRMNSASGTSYAPQSLETHTHTIGHRGVPSYAPGGTAPSYKLAKMNGLLIVEGDVRFTSDNVPVLFHDATYEVNGVTHTVANETYAQLKTYDIGAAFSADYAGTYVLTLAEFLDLCNDLQLFPTIEFKTGTTQQINNCLTIIDAKRAKVFNYKASVENLKTIIDHDQYASVRLGADNYSETLYNNLVDILNYGNKTHVTHCVYSTYGAWTAANIQKCRDAGAIIGVSSINSNENLKALTEDVDIIFTESGFNATMYKTINIIEES